MVLCAPYRNWRGFNWDTFEEKKDGYFVLQYNSWWESFRILIHKTKSTFLIAQARDKQEILQDWAIIQDEFDKEIKRVGSKAFSEYHLLNFFETLAKIYGKNDTSNKTEILTPAGPEDAQETELLTALKNNAPKEEVLSIIQKSTTENINEKDKQGVTALHIVCSMNAEHEADQLEICKQLVTKGAHINAKDADGWTPLHCACYGANLFIASFLMEKNAHVLALTRDETLAFSYLCRKNFSRSKNTDTDKLRIQLDLMSAMMQRGVSVNNSNASGETTIHQASQLASPEVVTFLLDHGANVNSVNRWDETPLHYVAKVGRKKMTVLLVERGADPTIRNVQGKTAAEVAASNGFEQLHLFLTALRNPEPAAAQPIPVTAAVEEEPLRVPRRGTTSSSVRQVSIDLSLQSPSSLRNSEILIPSTPPQAPTRAHSDSSLPKMARSTRDALKSSISIQDLKLLRLHCFQLTRLSALQECDFCHSFMWGINVQGYACQHCSMNVHIGCKKQAIFHTVCTRVPDEPAVQFEEDESEILSLSYIEAFKIWLNDRETELLYKEFEAMDVQQTGYVILENFLKRIGSIMTDMLGTSLFKLMDEDKDGKLDFKSFVLGMIVLMKSDAASQLEYGFQLFQPDEEGYVSRKNFMEVTEAIQKSLGAIQVNVHKFVKDLFDAADTKGIFKITYQQYEPVATKNRVYIQSLGLVNAEAVQSNSPEMTALLEKGKVRNPITFGHDFWDISYSMLFGIRLAVAEAASAQALSPKKPEAKDYDTIVDYQLNYISNSPDPWKFRDFAPVPFHYIRELLRIDPKSHMFSLGPEKVLGNILLGNISSLCELVTSSRSGSFFYRTSDSKYLVKTLPIEEHTLLLRLLPSYYEHLQRNPNSLLSGFLGLHTIRKGNEKDTYFTVMQNVFDSPLTIHEQYDLKGSTVDRHVKSEPDPDIALKDNNLREYNRCLNLTVKHRAYLLEQLEHDLMWMEGHGLCDYSFLLGIHHISDDEANVLFQNNTSTEESNSNNKRRSSFLNESAIKHNNTTTQHAHNIFKHFYGGILSADKKEVYFVGIIDNLTAWGYKKLGEHMAKSMFHDPNEISAIRPGPYRIRFQKYISSILLSQ